MKKEKLKRASYRLEYKIEAVRLVQKGQACAVTAKILGIPQNTLENAANTVVTSSSKHWANMAYKAQ